MLLGRGPLSTGNAAKHGSVVSIAKTGMSVKSRQMPATANSLRPAIRQWRFLALPIDRVNELSGIRQRSSTWRRLPIQKGLSRLRTWLTQRIVPGIANSVDCPGAGYPQCIGRISLRECDPARTTTGANAPSINGPPAQASWPASAPKSDAISKEVRSSLQSIDPPRYTHRQIGSDYISRWFRAFRNACLDRTFDPRRSAVRRRNAFRDLHIQDCYSVDGPLPSAARCAVGDRPVAFLHHPFFGLHTEKLPTHSYATLITPTKTLKLKI